MSLATKLGAFISRLLSQRVSVIPLFFAFGKPPLFSSAIYIVHTRTKNNKNKNFPIRLKSETIEEKES